MAKPHSALALTRSAGISRGKPCWWPCSCWDVILGRVLSPVFLSSANLSNMLADFTEIALIALPMTLIIVAAEIDLSVASVLGASSALMGVLWHMGLPMPRRDRAIVLVAGTLAGLFNGLVIVRFNLPSLAVTIGTLALFRGLAYVLLGDQAVADFPASYTAFGMDTIAAFLPMPFVLVDRRGGRFHGAAASDPVRAQPLRDRCESGCRAVFRHRRGAHASSSSSCCPAQ